MDPNRTVLLLETMERMELIGKKVKLSNGQEGPIVFVEYEAPETEFETALDEVLDRTGPGGPAALVLGQWGEAFQNKAPLPLLIDRADRMSGLRSFMS